MVLLHTKHKFNSWISLWQMLCAPPGSDTVPSIYVPMWVEQLASLSLACNRLPNIQLACAAWQAHCLQNCWLPLQYCCAAVQLNHTSDQEEFRKSGVTQVSGVSGSF